MSKVKGEIAIHALEASKMHHTAVLMAVVFGFAMFKTLGQPSYRRARAKMVIGIVHVRRVRTEVEVRLVRIQRIRSAPTTAAIEGAWLKPGDYMGTTLEHAARLTS